MDYMKKLIFHDTDDNDDDGTLTIKDILDWIQATK